MSLLQLTRVQVGEVGVLPGTIKMVSTNDLNTITTAGYLNNNGSMLTAVNLAPSDVIECLYSFNTITGTGSFVVLKPSISNGLITLVNQSSSGTVTPAQVQSAAFNTLVTVPNTNTAYKATLSPAPDDYTKAIYFFTPNVTSSGSSVTLDINSIGARPIYVGTGSAPLANQDMISGNTYVLLYHPGGFQLLNGSVSSITRSTYWNGAGTNYLSSFLSNAITLTGTQSNAYNVVQPIFKGMTLTSDISATNTGKTTLKYFDNNVYDVVSPDGSPLLAGMIGGSSGVISQFILDNSGQFILTNPGVPLNTNVSTFTYTPTTGSTINLNAANSTNLIVPATNLAALTLTMFNTTTALTVDTATYEFIFTKNVTTLTINGNGNTVLNPITSITAGDSFKMTYQSTIGWICYK